jgi:hypothetical protein
VKQERLIKDTNVSEEYSPSVFRGGMSKCWNGPVWLHCGRPTHCLYRALFEFFTRQWHTARDISVFPTLISCVWGKEVSRDSAVGIATGYWLDDWGIGVQVPVGSRIFISPCRPDRFWGSTQPPIQWIPGALSPGVKRPGREADHSRPTNTEVKKMWIYTSTSPYGFME